MSDQTRMAYFIFVKKQLEHEILNCQNRQRCFGLDLNLQEMIDLQLPTSSSIAIAFEGSNDEGGYTIVFRS